MKPKTNNVGLRLDDEELARLRMLAAHFGLRQTEVLRMILKHEADAISSAANRGAT